MRNCNQSNFSLYVYDRDGQNMLGMADLISVTEEPVYI